MKNLLMILCLPVLFSCSSGQIDALQNTPKQDALKQIEPHRPSPVETIQAPTTASIGQEVEVEVHFRVFNGCGQFGKFNQEVTGTTRTIGVQAVYKGEICTQDIPLRTTTYRFTPKEKGEHILRFHAENDQYKVARIQVE